MATESNLQKIHVFPTAESYEQNQGSIGADDIAFVPDKPAESGGGIPVVTTSGTGEAYEAQIPGITELKNGLLIQIIPHVTNSSSTCTFNLNGLGAKRIKRFLSTRTTIVASGSSVISANYLVQNAPINLLYVEQSGTAEWILVDFLKTMANDIRVAPSNDYTENQVRGISLQTSTPSRIPNGSIVGVYST